MVSIMPPPVPREGFSKVGKPWANERVGSRAKPQVSEACVIGMQSNRIFMVSSLRVRIGGKKRSEEHTSELQSLMRISYAVFCLKKKKQAKNKPKNIHK